MRLQILQDGKGNETGVFIPMEDWEIIKSQYPDILSIDNEIPVWQKELLDERLKSVNENPDCIFPVDRLFKVLDSNF